VKSATPGNLTVQYVAVCRDISSQPSAGVTVKVTEPEPADTTSPSTGTGGGNPGAPGTGGGDDQ